MSKHAKKTRVAVSLTVADATRMALMFRLHSSYCYEQSSKAYAAQSWRKPGDEIERVRLNNVGRSWGRAERKAREFAIQLEQLSGDASARQFPIPAVTKIR